MVVSTAGRPSYNTPLFDVTTKDLGCSQGAGVDQSTNATFCTHSIGMWQVWTADSTDELIVLGDLSAYVSLSGYRFRLPAGVGAGAEGAGEGLIAVGQPGEEVSVTYLRKLAGTWIVHVQLVTIGEQGRSEFTLN
jgi:hypothetical protein